ncbi:MAG: N-acetyltransferase family protein [Fimbriimonadaceae bacterium]
MNIRPATPQDQSAIQKIVSTVYAEFNFGWDPEGYNKDLSEIETHYKTPNNFWVAEENNHILGCVGIELFPTQPGKPGELTIIDSQPRIAAADCELVRLYLAKEARGKQVGYQLAQTCIAYAQSQNCQNMEIWSDKVLHKAHQLYQSLGAKIIGERICPPPDETPEWGMILELNKLN